MTKNEVKGWILTGTNPDKYTIKANHEVFHTGSKSGYLGITQLVDEGQFGTLM